MSSHDETASDRIISPLLSTKFKVITLIRHSSFKVIIYRRTYKLVHSNIENQEYVEKHYL
jgi:hypothetical protein